MKNNIWVAVAAMILGAVLVSGLAVINFNHTPNFDKLIQSSYFKHQIIDGELNVYLTSGIKDPDGYIDLLMLLEQHKHDKTVKIWLSGFGGSGHTMMNLINYIQKSKTQEEMIVSGNVYSAHAFLAISGDKMTVLNPHSYLMFHVGAINKDGENLTVNDYCKTKEGEKDRGVDAVQKCFDYAEANRKMMEDTLYNKVKLILGEKKYQLMLKGHDIYISSGKVKERLNNESK